MSKSILAFVYDFPHEKSVQGLLRLASLGYKDVLCVAAPKKKLNINHSPTRITPICYAQHPKDVAKVFGFEYVVSDHDDLKIRDIDVGIILGARILPQSVTSQIPIINFHPGLLPQNRGLDNVKWAIYKDLPQAVTAHIVDDKIDRGVYLAHEVIDVFYDDTLMDIHLRLLYKQIEIIEMVLANFEPKHELEKHVYRTAMTRSEEAMALSKFKDYKENYQLIRQGY